jgi:hypothetical protein
MLWVYGEPKIGKTTWVNSLGGVWFVATEKGQEFVGSREPTYITSWKEFREFVEWIATAKPVKFSDGTDIKWLSIDVVDDLHKMCTEFVCKSLSVEDPGELDHGKGWARLRTEWYNVMNVVRRLPYGLVCLSHEKTVTIKAKGQQTSRVEPQIGASGYSWCRGLADLIVRMHAVDVPEKDSKGNVTGKIRTVRALRLHPDSSMVAGGRMSEFLPPVLATSMPNPSASLITVLAKKDASQSAVSDAVSDAAPQSEVSPQS